MRTKINYQDDNVIPILTNALSKLINSIDPYHNRDIVVVCIGSDRVLGDTVGPLTGTYISRSTPELQIYGQLGSTVAATNIKSIIKLIPKDVITIAIDASIGVEIDNIIIQPGSCDPGAATGKKLPSVGDITITAVICNPPKGMEHMTLMCQPLTKIFAISEIIAKVISNWYDTY